MSETDFCGACGKYIPIEDLIFSEYSESEVCEDCYASEKEEAELDEAEGSE